MYRSKLEKGLAPRKREEKPGAETSPSRAATGFPDLKMSSTGRGQGKPASPAVVREGGGSGSTRGWGRVGGSEILGGGSATGGAGAWGRGRGSAEIWSRGDGVEGVAKAGAAGGSGGSTGVWSRMSVTEGGAGGTVECGAEAGKGGSAGGGTGVWGRVGVAEGGAGGNVEGGTGRGNAAGGVAKGGPETGVWGRGKAVTEGGAGDRTGVWGRVEGGAVGGTNVWGRGAAGIRGVAGGEGGKSVGGGDAGLGGVGVGRAEFVGRGEAASGSKEETARPNMNYLENQTESCDFIKTRPSPDKLSSKKGESGKPTDIKTNYYALNTLTNFNLFQYHLDFKPDEERTEVRKKLVRVHEATLGAFIFDGQSLFTPTRIMLNPMELYSLNCFNNKKIQICLKLVAEIAPVDPIFLQVYNIIFRNIMTSLELELMGRFYYDPVNKTSIPSRKLEVWPGYITSVRNHENQILLNVELTHKVVRADSVLDFMNSIRIATKVDFKKEIMKQLLGSIVLTRYNKKNYRIDDIKWDVSPREEFPLKGGGKKSYIAYYKEQYGVTVKDNNQPMLVSLPKKKDYHRGSTQPIYLVPELCQMTGLTDNMRKDNSLMKDLTGYLTLSPKDRVIRTNKFLDRWHEKKITADELIRWNIEINRAPVVCMGRVVELDDIIVGPKAVPGNAPNSEKNTNGEWINVFKSRPMLSTTPLKTWVLIMPQHADSVTDQLIATLRTTAKTMGFTVDQPLIKFKIIDSRPSSFSAIIQQLHEQTKGKVQMFVVVLPNNNPEVYSAIKKKCYIDLGVASQCVIIKTLMTKNIASVSSRLAVQMNTKLGGEAWSVSVPLRNMMIVGYDVFHSPSRKVPSVGALVASTSDTFARYLSQVHFHKSRSELSANLCSAMTRALMGYQTINRVLPARILMYRDGVGDGQLSYIYNTELQQIQDAIRSVYAKALVPQPKFSFIVVTKRIHTRIFVPCPGGEENPPPGTIVDDSITLPERYDFFMVSQNVGSGQGTVSPTNYNVLVDEQGLTPDKMQRLTLKLCHLYFNYTGTIAVPAPCQFAHKLAFITGQSLHGTTHPALQNHLFFL